MATSKKTTTKKQAPAKRNTRARRPQPDIAQSWSILLFGIGAVLIAMIFVPGQSLWAWLRNTLFGVFGVGAYALGALVIYVAVLVALGKPIWGKCAKALLLMMFICGTAVVFSKTDLTGLSMWGSIKALFEQGQGILGGGVLGGIIGGTLLVLCGRPAANILLVVLLAACAMWFAGVTPGDLWELAEVHFEDARDRREAAREARPKPQPRLQQPPRSRIEERQAEMEERRSRRRCTSVDIDLGPDPVSEVEMDPQPDEPLVGPGGTFGMFPPQDLGRSEPVKPEMPEAEPVPEESFETSISFGAEQPAEAEEASPANVLDELVQKAIGFEEPGVLEDIPQALDVPLGETVIGETMLPQTEAPAAAAAAENPAAVLEAAEPVNEYQYPPLELFENMTQSIDPGVEEELKKNAELLVSTLESFGVRTRVLDICRGPSVTRYELQPLAGVKISRITGLADDIALNLAASGVRIEAPIPGKPAVGVEVPNRKKSPVGIRSIFESQVYTKSASPLTMALGKDIAGNAQIADLCKMPHLLIAGSTGSGKSVCVNSMIVSFLYKASPEDVRLILIDPKVVELAEYNGIPHLLMPVVTEPRKAAGALGSAVAEMENRYRLFAENNVRDIKSYNRMAAQTEGMEKLPYVVIVIDELADLMMVAGKEVEDYICRIAQKARAAGMHLIVATQRPSVDVITGLIKANIPSRIAFAVSSQVDSRTILDAGGAEKLLGMGDMLFMPVGASKPVRIQGTYVKDEEITAVLDFIKQGGPSQYNEEMIAQMDKLAAAEKSGGSSEEEGEDHDPMLDQAVEVVIDMGQASTSLLQRKCKLGYARAARIMDDMEQLGVIGPYQGAKPREVLITRQQWIERSMRSEPVPDEI